MNLLVTGGAGFIGSNYVRSVIEGALAGIDSITIIDNLTYAGVQANLNDLISHANVKFIKGDICDEEIVRNLLEGIDAIINFAAESHVDRSIIDATSFISTNVMGVQVLLDAIRKSNRRIRFLQVSTDEVYGSIEEGSWTEDSPLLPNSPYSASKAAGELLVKAYSKTYGLDVVITRSSNNYGPFHFPEKLIPLFITNVLENKDLPLYGSGKNIRDWLHVSDNCRAIHLVLMNGKIGEIYNIGGGSEFSNLEITHRILDQMGLDKSQIRYVPDRKGHDLRYSVNWTKIRKELGFEPRVDLDFGLSETIKWYQENNNWWQPLKSRVDL